MRKEVRWNFVVLQVLTSLVWYFREEKKQRGNCVLELAICSIYHCNCSANG